jgi:uncharacterized Zn finger protein
MKCPACSDELDPDQTDDAEVGDLVDCEACGAYYEVESVDESATATELVKLRPLDEEETAEVEDEDDGFLDDDEDEEEEDDDEDDEE